MRVNSRLLFERWHILFDRPSLESAITLLICATKPDRAIIIKNSYMASEVTMSGAFLVNLYITLYHLRPGSVAA